MWTIVFLGGLAALMILAKIFLQPARGSFYDRIQYHKVEYLLSEAELEFQAALAIACPDHLYICPKVRVGDVLKPHPNTHITRQRIDRKHFDWVLIDSNSAKILAAVELDDRSHLLETRAKRDVFLNDACERAGFPLIRFAVARRYDTSTIREAIGRMNKSA